MAVETNQISNEDMGHTTLDKIEDKEKGLRSTRATLLETF